MSIAQSPTRETMHVSWVLSVDSVSLLKSVFCLLLPPRLGRRAMRPCGSSIPVGDLAKHQQRTVETWPNDSPMPFPVLQHLVAGIMARVKCQKEILLKVEKKYVSKNKVCHLYGGRLGIRVPEPSYPCTPITNRERISVKCSHKSPAKKKKTLPTHQTPLGRLCQNQLLPQKSTGHVRSRPSLEVSEDRKKCQSTNT